MKLNVKGLVFVGFAAAILSANAMAATGDEKIVTSKAFTEATYQKLSNLTTQGSETGNILSTDNAADAKYPSEKAVASAIAASQSATTYTSDGTTITKTGNQFSATTGSIAENGGNLVTSGTIHTALAGKQNNLGGTANQIPVTTANAGVVTYKNIATASSGIATGEATIPTSGAVADAISGAVTGANLSQYELLDNKAESIIDSGEGANASSTTEYASNAAVTGYAQKKLSGTNGQLVTYGATAGTVGSATLGTSALTIRQNNVANATTFGANATSDVTIDLATPDWDAADSAAGYIVNKPTISNAGSGVSAATSAGSAKELATTYAVKEYVTSYAPSIPAVPTSGDNACDASHPCALVSDGGTPAWVRMAQ